MTSTIGEKEIKTSWPVEAGLDAGTTRQTGLNILVPEASSKVLRRDLFGI